MKARISESPFSGKTTPRALRILPRYGGRADGPAVKRASAKKP
jgi:hypothetical protein